MTYGLGALFSPKGSWDCTLRPRCSSSRGSRSAKPLKQIVHPYRKTTRFSITVQSTIIRAVSHFTALLNGEKHSLSDMKSLAIFRRSANGIVSGEKKNMTHDGRTLHTALAQNILPLHPSLEPYVVNASTTLFHRRTALIPARAVSLRT